MSLKQGKQGEIDRKRFVEKLVAITIKLLEHTCVTIMQHRKALTNCNYLQIMLFVLSKNCKWMDEYKNF